MNDRYSISAGAWLPERLQQLFTCVGVADQLEEALPIFRKRKAPELFIVPGSIVSRIAANETQSVKVELRTPCLVDKVWLGVGSSVAANAYIVGKLLAGELPQEIEHAFNAFHVSLFPKDEEVQITCECAGKGSCIHLAIFYFAINEKLENDPQFLLGFRGRDRHEFMADIRTARRALAPAADSNKRVLPAVDQSSLPTSPREGENFWSQGKAISELSFTIRADELPGQILRRHDPIPLAENIPGLEQVLEEAYNHVANRAQAFGLGLMKSAIGQTR